MENLIENKSFAFAVRIIRVCQQIQEDRKEYVLSKQLMRCGTSIGANVTEAQQAQSRADFVSKLSIALKESDETAYWLRLLHATDYISPELFASIYADCRELSKILVSIIKSSK